jgi:hypothetical protein
MCGNCKRIDPEAANAVDAAMTAGESARRDVS